MSITLTDPFGPALGRAVATAPRELDRATGRATAHVQRHIILGIRRQKYRGLWPALSPEYAARKEREGKGSNLLIREGDLSSSIEITKKAPGRYEVGTNLVYARAIEFGFAPRNLKARSYVGRGSAGRGRRRHPGIQTGHGADSVRAAHMTYLRALAAAIVIPSTGQSPFVAAANPADVEQGRFLEIEPRRDTLERLIPCCVCEAGDVTNKYNGRRTEKLGKQPEGAGTELVYHRTYYDQVFPYRLDFLGKGPGRRHSFIRPIHCPRPRREPASV